MRWLRSNLAELHAYGGLALASVGVGLLNLAAGMIVAGVGLFYLAHSIPARDRKDFETITGGRRAA